MNPRQSFRFYLIALMLVGALSACMNTGQVVKPVGMVQDIITAQTSLTVAINALADMHDAELARQEMAKAGKPVSPTPLITDKAYQDAKSYSKQASAMLISARTAATANDASNAQTLLTAGLNLIGQIALVNGGKK